MSILPKLYRNSSKGIQNVIINLGCNVFSYLKMDQLADEEILNKFSIIDKTGYTDINEKEMNQQKTIYDSKMKSMIDEYSSIIDKLKSTKNEVTNEYEDKINKMKTEMNTEIEEKISSIIEINNMKQEYMNHQIESLKNELLIEKENQRLVSIIEEKFSDKTDFKNPTEQGNYAEEILDEIVNSHELQFDDKTKIENTALTGGSGDRIITFSNGFRLMIEVKNKDTIKPTDIEQFEEHYLKDFNENKSDMAMFFSYRTYNITGKHKCEAICPRYFENDKIVYFGLDDSYNKVEKKTRLKNELHYIYRKYEESLLNKTDKSKTSDIYNDQLRLLKDNREYFTKEITKLKNEIDQDTKKLSEIDKNWNNIHHEILLNNISVDNSIMDEKLFKKIFIDKIKKWMTDNNVKLVEKERGWKQRIIVGMELSDYEVNKLKHNKYVSLKELMN